MAKNTTEQGVTYSLDREKAIVIYLYLEKKYKGNRSKIKFDKFVTVWNDMFAPHIKSYDKSQKKKLNNIQKSEFKFVKSKFALMTLDEIMEYRNQFKIYNGTDVPKELKQLAMKKDVFVKLSSTPGKHLSGFDIQVKDKQANKIYSLMKTPYILTEEDAKQNLESLPTKSELKAKEKKLKDILLDDTVYEDKECRKTALANKKKAVNHYKEPYATHEFKKFMNRYTLHQCKNQQLTLFCVELCRRVGIENLSNNKPIEYRFCEGSGKRKQTMRRIKKHTNKKNKK